MRYKNLSKEKSYGVVFTPEPMADFIASEIIKNAPIKKPSEKIYILDPAIGNADLAIKILGRAKQLFDLQKVVMYGYDIDENSVTISKEKIKDLYPEVELHIEQKDFLTINFHDDLFTPQVQFDFIIANPPYIRTQSIEESKVKYIASKFKLTGRFDMYYAFFIAALSVLKPDGIAGFITSNKFLTINSGKILREFLYSPKKRKTYNQIN